MIRYFHALIALAVLLLLVSFVFLVTFHVSQAENNLDPYIEKHEIHIAYTMWKKTNLHFSEQLGFKTQLFQSKGQKICFHLISDLPTFKTVRAYAMQFSAFKFNGHPPRARLAFHDISKHLHVVRDLAERSQLIFTGPRFWTSEILATALYPLYLKDVAQVIGTAMDIVCLRPLNEVNNLFKLLTGDQIIAITGTSYYPHMLNTGMIIWDLEKTRRIKNFVDLMILSSLKYGGDVEQYLPMTVPKQKSFLGLMEQSMFFAFRKAYPQFIIQLPYCFQLLATLDEGNTTKKTIYFAHFISRKFDDYYNKKAKLSPLWAWVVNYLRKFESMKEIQ